MVSSSGDFAPVPLRSLSDRHLGGHHAALLPRTQDRGPDHLVTAST